METKQSTLPVESNPIAYPISTTGVAGPPIAPGSRNKFIVAA